MVQEKVAGSPSQPKAKITKQSILESFQGEIEPVKVSFSYKLAIFFVSCVMVLLPLVYLGIVIAAGAAVCFHAVYSLAMFDGSVGGRGLFMLGMIYLAPIVAGGILVVFMIKPLFYGFGPMPKTLSLNKTGEPFLFAFVERICQAVGAPIPSRINVDCQVNASASFRHGMGSFFSNELVLTIGMPLVAGMDMRQVAGILAHEFGHFSQGAGMRLSYVIRIINAWFERVVYERDSWDDWLKETAGGIDLRIGFVLYLAMFCVWLTRRILWCLMMIGKLVCGFLMQQMEYDADRYEARLVGSEVFETSCKRLLVLSIAHQGAMADLAEFYQEGRLSDDLPKLILENVKQLPKDALKLVEEHISQDKSSVFETHPSDKDRIENAKKEGPNGIFQLNLPAKFLFQNYQRINKRVSLDLYREMLGPTVRESDLHDVDSLLKLQNEKKEAYESLRRFLQRDFAALRPFTMPSYSLVPPESAKEAAARLQKARKEMVQQQSDYSNAYKVYEKLDKQIVDAAQATSLLGCRFKLDAGEFKVPVDSLQNAKKAAKLAANNQSDLSQNQLNQFEKLAGERLFSALQLLYVPKLQEKHPEFRQKIRKTKNLLPILERINNFLPEVWKIRGELSSYMVLLTNLENNSENQNLIIEIRSLMKKLFKNLLDIRLYFKDYDYPFEHGSGTISISDFLVKDLPLEEDPGGIFQSVEECLDRLLGMFQRSVSTLAETAEVVEISVGLKRLPDPPEVRSAEGDED